MLARAFLAVPTLLFCAGLLPAQAEPPLARQLNQNPILTPLGAVGVSDLTIRNLPNGHKFIGRSHQQSLGGPHVLTAHDYNPMTNTLSSRPDFSGLALSTQEIDITPDLNTIAVFLAGVGARIAQRASTTSPWGSLQPIGGLTGNEYGLQFCSIRGVLSLAVIKPPPNSHFEIYPFDAAQGSVNTSNPVIVTPPLGSPTNSLACIIPLDDDLSWTRGFLGFIRQQVGFNEQCVFTGGVDGTSAWSVFFNTPLNSFFIGGAQLRGGYVVGANFGLPFGTSIPNGAIDMIGAFMFDTRASILGGATDLTAMGPPGDLCVIAIATGLIPAVPLPGFLGNLGVDPGGILSLYARTMPSGTARQPLVLPPWSPIVFALQSLALAAAGPNVLGGTGSLSLN